MRHRISFKLFSVFAVIGMVAAAIAGWVIERRLDHGLIRWIEEEMTAEARTIALIPAEKIAGLAGELAERSGSRITLIDAGGRVLADSDERAADPDNHLNRSELQEARLKGKGVARRYSRTLKVEMIYLAVPLLEGQKITGYIRLSRRVSETAGSIDPLRQHLLRDILLILLFSLLAGLIFTVRAVSPLRKLALFTEKIRRGGASGMIRIGSQDEIGELAENINGLVAALQEKIRAADEERRKLESVFAGMAEGVMVLDPDLRIETLNRGMEEMIGRSAGDIVGRTLLEAFRNIPLHDALEHFRETKETVFREIILGDGSPVVTDVTISAVEDNPDGVGKTMLVFHDVTRQKRLERIRTDFVANVTHEIRTPLTAIIGFAETLLQGAVDDRAKTMEFLRTILENARRLNRLVDDLITLSGIELGEAKLRLEDLDVATALDQTLAVVMTQASEKQLRIIREIPPALPRIRADRDRLAQILLNVLDNAVKFTPAGGTVSVTATSEQGRLTVRIADTGVGIARGEIPRLGERFYRADKARSRELGGTGLGLSIVKHLMKAHEGQMAIDSTLGRGTTVSLHFPVSKETK